MKIQEIKNIFPHMQLARFNVAAWQKPGGDSLSFIGREVAIAGEMGEPDTGILKLFEFSKDGTLLREKVIWQPIYEGINLEDPRVLELPHENIVIGLTAVFRDKQGLPIPFPAIVTIDSFSSWGEELPPFLVVDTFGPGKNLTPIEKNMYIFRPDAKEYFHKLLVFSLHSQIPEKLDDIVFPKDLPWALWRIGTTMPPIWITPTQALFLVHGISIEKNTGKYIYSIGRAKLTRKGNTFTIQVAKEPILTPDNFLDIHGKPLVVELHPDIKRVIYSCGGIIKNNAPGILSLYVNVGDRTTFEVKFSLDELKKGLF